MMVPQESVTALDDLYAAYGYESADSYGALYAQSGAINADMLMSIKGKDNDIHVQVTEMRYSDNVFALNATADINNSLPDKHVIKAEITSEFKPNYDKLMNDALSLSVFDMMQDPMLAMIMPGIASYVENIPEDERNQFMQDIMPSYERLGKLVIAVDAVLPKSQASDETATAEATADAPTSAIEVKRFEISSDLGGFLLSGSSGKLDQISIPSEVNGTLTCLKCTTMLDELYAYQNDLAPHLQAAAPETASEIPLADSKLVQAVKSFLQSAAKDPKATDLSYELALNDQATTINGKPAEELMMAFFTDVAPLLPQPQAAQDDEETEEDSTDESEDTESAE
jgi:hypothetical protein